MPEVYHDDPTIYADLIPAQRALRAFLLGITASLPVELPSVRPQYRWTVKRRLRILAYVEAHSLRATSWGGQRSRQSVRPRDECARTSSRSVQTTLPAVHGELAVSDIGIADGM